MKTPSWSRAFSTLGCVEHSLEDVASLAKRHGLETIELRGLSGSLDLPEVLQRTFGKPERLVERLGELGIRICAIDTSLKLIGNTAAERDDFRRYLPWAEALGVDLLRVFDGGASFDAAEQEKALDTLSWWNELRRAEGWRADMMVETHDAFVRTEATRRFIAQAPAGTKLLWDTHHTWRLGGEEIEATWAALRPHVVHIHVKDSVANPSAARGYTYVPPGQGEFAMATLRELLARDGYDGVVSLEWERHWHPGLTTLDEALASAAATRWW